MRGHASIRIVLIILVLIATGCITRSDRVLTVDGDRRTYHLHVPEAYDETTPLPLLLVLHPFGSTGKSMARITGFNAVADREAFIAVYPDGELRRWRAVARSNADVEFLTRLLDRIESMYVVDRDRVYITGASNGAHMTYRMLCESGSRFAAAATVMGAQTLARFHESCADAPPVPLLMIHGTHDRILPWEGRRWPKKTPLLSMEETLRVWRARNGCTGDGMVETLPDVDVRDGTTTARTVFEAGPGGAPIELYTVMNGGHTWPGGDHRYPKWLAGATARDFSASSVIWRFFEHHRRGRHDD